METIAVAVRFPIRPNPNRAPIRRPYPVATDPNPSAALEVEKTVRPDEARAWSITDWTINRRRGWRTDDHARAVIPATASSQSAGSQQHGS